MQEALFQSAAILMGEQAQQSQSFGVISKVAQARFKGMARPGDQLVMEVEQVDQLDNAYYFKGRTRVKGKVIVSLEFTCALVSQGES